MKTKYLFLFVSIFILVFQGCKEEIVPVSSMITMEERLSSDIAHNEDLKGI